MDAARTAYGSSRRQVALTPDIVVLSTRLQIAAAAATETGAGITSCDVPISPGGERILKKSQPLLTPNSIDRFTDRSASAVRSPGGVRRSEIVTYSNSPLTALDIASEWTEAIRPSHTVAFCCANALYNLGKKLLCFEPIPSARIRI